MPRVRVVIADDHPMYRRGVGETIRRFPELELVGEAEDGRSAVGLVKELRPHVAVLDMRLPGLDGLRVLEAIVAADVATRVLFLSGHVERERVYQALAAGAAGFLSKNARGREICEAVLRVERGETVLGSEVQSLLAEEIRTRAPRGQVRLTEREHEVLRLTSEGMSAPEIGARLHLSRTTVKGHLESAYEKLGVSDRAAAVAEAMRRGLLD